MIIQSQRLLIKCNRNENHQDQTKLIIDSILLFIVTLSFNRLPLKTNKLRTILQIAVYASKNRNGSSTFENQEYVSMQNDKLVSMTPLPISQLLYISFRDDIEISCRVKTPKLNSLKISFFFGNRKNKNKKSLETVFQ